MISIVDILAEMFSFAFLVRAFVVGLLVSLCASLLGLSLVMKRYSMIGTGLSNVGFGSLGIAIALNAAPLLVSIPVVIAAAFLLLRLSESSKIRGDAAIALVSTSSLAIGVVIISLTTGMNLDVCNFMFGSILAMSRNDVYLSIALSVTVFILYIFFYHKLFAITFDESFAKAGGVKVGVYNMLIALLTALTIVLGMRLMGAMLISSLIIFPALTSMRIFKQFKTVTVCSAIVATTCFFIGIIVSYLYNTPAGASVVMVNIFVFLLFWAISAARNILSRKNISNGGAMKKAALVSMVLVLFITGCGNGRNAEAGGSTEGRGLSRASAAGTVEIRENMFITQINEILLNYRDYIGRTVKLEGMFRQFHWEGNNTYVVIRNTPGCCGDDGIVGFEVSWNQDFQGLNDDSDGSTYPSSDDWVEAQGVLKSYEDLFGGTSLFIALSELNVLEKRGMEFVTR